MAERYLGIDFGGRRIGLAVADADSKLARPLTTVAPAEFAATLASEAPFAVVVVGLPRGLDGQDTLQTLAVRRWADDMLGDQTVVFQDEAGTSSLAEDELRASGRAYQAADIDAQAAAIILQDYLDNV